MANTEIRNLIKSKGLKHYYVAELLNVDTCTFSKWLSRPLNKEHEQAILKALEGIEKPEDMPNWEVFAK